MSNQQILKTVTSTLLIAGGALANHLEVRRARRDRIVGRVLEFVGELPPAIITQLSTVNPDAWRALLRDLASITRERAADSTDVMSAFAQGVAMAMETATASSASTPTSSCKDEASAAERAAVIDLLRQQIQPILAEHGPLLASIRLSDILGSGNVSPTDAEDAPSTTSAESPTSAFAEVERMLSAIAAAQIAGDEREHVLSVAEARLQAAVAELQAKIDQARATKKE